MSRLPPSLVPLLFLCLPACASRTALPEGVRSAANQRLAGKIVELRQSCYYGDLYDDNGKWLLSPHAFDYVHHIVDVGGRPIHPKNQRGIVRAGTRFRVDRIEFPDFSALAKRMLTTPRYNPWVYLRPADDSIRLPTERRHWILLLPRDLDDPASLDKEIARLLAPEGEVQGWLEKRRPTIRVAIEHKDLVAGMTIEEVVAAMGEPRHFFKDERDGQPVQVLWFGTQEAWFAGTELVEVRRAREARPDAAR